MFAASASLLLASVVSTAPASSVPAAGIYETLPTATPLGPKSNKLMMEVLYAPEAGEGVWWMRDHFISGQITGSYQQYWVDPSLDTIAYCGMLRHWMLSPHGADSQDFAPVWQPYVRSALHSTATSNVWCAHSEAGGCSLTKYNVTVLSPTSFQIVLHLGGPSVHLDATFTMNPALKYPNRAKEHRHCQVIASKALSGNGWDADDIPRRSDVPGSAGAAAAAAAAVPARTEYKSAYEHCYVVHNASEFRVEWSMKSNTTVDLQFSANALGGWASLGLYPKFPGMLNAKVLLGSPSSGVQVMEATDYVGTPTPSAWTTVVNGSVAVERAVRTTTKAVFALPPMPQPFGQATHGEVYWAFGQEAAAGRRGAGGKTEAVFEYHGYNRGIFTVYDWSRPELTLPTWLKC